MSDLESDAKDFTRSKQKLVERLEGEKVDFLNKAAKKSDDRAVSMLTEREKLELKNLDLENKIADQQQELKRLKEAVGRAGYVPAGGNGRNGRSSSS